VLGRTMIRDFLHNKPPSLLVLEDSWPPRLSSLTPKSATVPIITPISKRSTEVNDIIVKTIFTISQSPLLPRNLVPNLIP